MASSDEQTEVTLLNELGSLDPRKDEPKWLTVNTPTPSDTAAAAKAPHNAPLPPAPPPPPPPLHSEARPRPPPPRPPLNSEAPKVPSPPRPPLNSEAPKPPAPKPHAWQQPNNASALSQSHIVPAPQARQPMPSAPPSTRGPALQAGQPHPGKPARSPSSPAPPPRPTMPSAPQPQMPRRRLPLPSAPPPARASQPPSPQAPSPQAPSPQAPALMWQPGTEDGASRRVRPPNPLERYQTKAQPKAQQPKPKAPKSEPPAAEEPGEAPPALHLELIWQSDDSEGRIAADPALGRRPTAPQPEDESKANTIIGLPPELDKDEPDDAPTQATVAQAALRSKHVTPIGELQPRLHRSLAEDHTDEPPLVLLRGRLLPQLNAQQVLQTMIDTAKPLATDGSNLESELTQVASFVSTPLMQNAAIVERLTAQLLKAWAGERHGLPDAFLKEHAEGVVLRERGYATLKVLGEPCILCHLAYDDARVPLYLPERHAQRLPLMTSFDGRVIAELFSQQDDAETAAVSLRPLVLARVLPGTEQPAK